MAKKKGLKSVEELMIILDDYPYVQDTDTIKRAMEVLTTTTIDRGGKKSLPRILLVFDGLGILVGTLRRRDMMRGLEPDFMQTDKLKSRDGSLVVKFDPDLTRLSGGSLLNDLKVQAEHQVYNVMLPVRSWIYIDDHITKDIYEMVSNNLSLLPVVKGKKVVGVLRSVDLFQELVDQIL